MTRRAMTAYDDITCHHVTSKSEELA